MSDRQVHTSDNLVVDESKTQFKKSFTLINACALLISSVGGTSLFIAVSTILGYAGSPGMALILWILGGFINLGRALAVIELALMFPKAGGAYFYIHQIIGKLVGFVFLWGFVIFIAGSTWAINSYLTSIYILTMIYADCPPPQGLDFLLATLVMVSIVVLNCTSMKAVTRFQTFLSSCKLVAMTIIITVGLLYLRTDIASENLSRMMVGTSSDPGSLALGIFTGYYSFGGWQLIFFMTEEMKHPEKILPRCMLASFSTLITMMGLTVFSYSVVLSKEEMLESEATAILFGNRVHSALAIALFVLINLCNLASLNSLVMGQPRLLYAAGKNQQAPEMMTLLHRKFKTPWPATFTMCVIGFIMLSMGNISTLLNIVSLYSGIMSTLLMSCILYLRWKKPEIHRPVKLPTPLIVGFFCLTSCLMVLSIISKPKELGTVVIVVLFGMPIYFIFVKWQKPAQIFYYVVVITKYVRLLFDLE